MSPQHDWHVVAYRLELFNRKYPRQGTYKLFRAELERSAHAGN